MHQSLTDGKKNLFFDAKGKSGMSKLFESFLAGQIAVLMEFAPMFWPTVNSYKRLVDGFLGTGQTYVGSRQPDRELSRDPRFVKEHAA